MDMETLVPLMVMEQQLCVIQKQDLVKYLWKCFQILTKTLWIFPNFDETEKEPAVLHKVSNLLVNGTSELQLVWLPIFHHNITEIINAVVKMIDNIIEEDRNYNNELLESIRGLTFQQVL